MQDSIDINRFMEGMNQDFNPINQPPNSFRYALNFVPMSKDGNITSITNENGTVLMNVTFPTGFKVIGYSVLYNEIIVILVDSTGHSQVGIISQTGSTTAYIAIAPQPIVKTDPIPTNNIELGFNINYPVDCVSRKLINGHRILYYTDNNRPFGIIDLDNPPVVGDVSNQISLIRNQLVPIIDLKSIVEDVASSIKPGVTSFITRYVTENGGYTDFGIPSNPISIVPSKVSDGVNNYHGAFNEDGTISKNIVLTISNLDLQYKSLEIIAIYYQGNQSTFNAVIAGTVPITSSSIDFTYTGPLTENAINLTLSELRKIPVTYNKAKCIEQKDNILFLSNLSSRASYDAQLQHVANNIDVSYKIEEVLFDKRGDNHLNSATGFDISVLPYVQDSFHAAFKMTKPVWDTSDTGNTDYDKRASDSSKYAYVAMGKQSQCDIEFYFDGGAFNQLSDGDTITLPTDNIGGTITFRFKNTPTLANDILLPTGGGFDDNNRDAILGLESIINTRSIVVGSNTLSFYCQLIADKFTDGALTSYHYILRLYWSNRTTNMFGLIGSHVSSTATGITFTPYTANSLVAQPTIFGVGSVNVVDKTISLFPAPKLLVPSDGYTPYYIDDYSVLVVPGDSLAMSSVSNPIYDNTISESWVGTYYTIGDGSSSSTTVNHTFDDYINEDLGFNKKGYRRGEVYSLGFYLLFKDNTYTYTYHIPGKIPSSDSSGLVSSSDWPAYTASIDASSNHRLGSYISTDEYPLNQNYPGNVSGDDTAKTGTTSYPRNIRHHYIPELENEPHFVVRGTTTYIRILGLEFKLNVAIPDELKKDVAEIVFVRERRNIDNNRSIIAQGLVNRCIITADKFTNDGIVDGQIISGGVPDYADGSNSDILDGYFVTEMPFFNNLTTLHFTGSDQEKSGAHSSNGVAYPGNIYAYAYVYPPTSHNYHDGWNLAPDIKSNQGFFHSPETDLLTGYKPDENNLSGLYMKRTLKLTGNYYKLNTAHDSWYSGPGVDYLQKYMYSDYYCDYANYTREHLTDIKTIKKARFSHNGFDRLAPLDTTNFGLLTSTRWTPGGFEVLLNGSEFEGADTEFEIHNNPQISDDPTISFGHAIHATSGIRKTSDLTEAVNGNVSNYMYNLKRQLNNQYGTIGIGEYIIVDRKTLQDDNNYKNIFGGDTFITKYSFNTSQLINYFPYDRTKDAGVNRPFDSASQRINGYGQIDGIKKGGDDSIAQPGAACGWDFRSCSYYFVESDINTYYRHLPTPVDIKDGSGNVVISASANKQNYFPNTPNVGAMLDNFIGYLGMVNAYNTQYSYENNIKTFYAKGATTQVITTFENRTIYSEVSSGDDVVDSYRSLLQNNVYDLPTNTGPIWDTFVAYDTLFMHTPKSLWSTFAEPAAILQGSNISDVVLGTGTLFARPSQEVMTTKGGYGGTLSQFGGTLTELGYIFPDTLQGKIFLLAVDKAPYLKELSNQGLMTFFTSLQDLVKTSGVFDFTNLSTVNSHLLDNPYNGIGICSGYDYKLHRALLTKQGTNPFTISYSTLLNKWFSFHSYIPNGYITFDNRIFLLKDGPIYELNIGPKGKYFTNSVQDSVIELVCAKASDNKIFNNVTINSSSDDDGVKIRDDNFDKLQVFTDRMNTGEYTLRFPNGYGDVAAFGEKFIKYKNEEYRIAVPRDAVVDATSDIFDPTNLIQDQIPTTVIFANRIRGQYSHFKFTYNNENNYNFVIRLISIIFNVNFR